MRHWGNRNNRAHVGKTPNTWGMSLRVPKIQLAEGGVLILEVGLGLRKRVVDRGELAYDIVGGGSE